MDISMEKILEWAIPVAIFFTSFIVGFIFEWIIMKSVRRFAKNTRNKWDDILIFAFSHAFIYWFILAGFYFGIMFSPISPELKAGLQSHLGALAMFVGVIVLGRIVFGLIKFGIDSSTAIPAGTLIPNIGKTIILIIGLLFIISNFYGTDIYPILGALGVGGLAAALAFQDTLANLFAGIQMLLSRKIRPGDFITLDSGKTGFVMDISWRETTIKDFSNNMIIVPNSKLANDIVVNHNLPVKNIYFELVCGIGYESDLEQVEKTVLETTHKVYEDVMGEKLEADPVFFFLEFADSAITFKLKVLVKEFGHRMKVRHPMLKALHKRFNEEGINIPYPIRTVLLEKED